MEEHPFVSVLMPVRNEQEFIARSLGAVLAQRYPADRIEVIVADGQSEDLTRDIIRSLPGADRVRIIENPQRAQSYGLNLALRAARGAIVARVDGHTIIAPDYIQACVRALRETGAANVGGRMEPRGQTVTGRAIAAASGSRFGVPSAFRVSERAQYTDTVYLGAWWRQAVVEAGGFEERLLVNEDYELNYRLRAAGGLIYLDPAIRSEYYGRQTLGALARQYFRYGWDRVNTLRLHPGSLMPRQLVASAFVAALVVTLCVGVALSVGLSVTLGALGWAPLAALLALYMVADGIACVALARRAGWRVALVALMAFPTIHLAWGMGFWVGVIGITPWKSASATQQASARGAATTGGPAGPAVAKERAEESRFRA